MQSDVVIIGAGAAGLMCAITAGRRGRSVVILERNDAIGEKIRISGGGRCNFTNIVTDSESYLSDNSHFSKSALARFTPSDFIALVDKHGISYHEKKLGQLFCDDSSHQIISMLLSECQVAGVKILTGRDVSSVSKTDHFAVATSRETFEGRSLVIATGGLSIPKLGATDFGYRIARQFGVNVVDTRPGLVPLTFAKDDLSFFADLSGVSHEAVVSCDGTSFRENVLFTHRGLSGPAILQVSSYWKPGGAISIDLSPDVPLLEFLKSRQRSSIDLSAALSELLPKRLAQHLSERYAPTIPFRQYSSKVLETIASQLHCWEIRPVGTEGYGKAEVTVGGVDTRELSSKTMEAQRIPGLYFIGEVVDVTGHLGGYNFQWAWASGYAAGQYV